MLPDFHVVAGGQHTDAALAFDAGPAAGLGAMLRRRRHKEIGLGVVQLHEIVLVHQRERGGASSERMPLLRFHVHRTLSGMLGERAAHQAAQHEHLSIHRARVDRQEAVPLTDVRHKGLLDPLRDPVTSVGR